MVLVTQHSPLFCVNRGCRVLVYFGKGVFRVEKYTVSINLINVDRKKLSTLNKSLLARIYSSPNLSPPEGLNDRED